jgi:hypothetical protein
MRLDSACGILLMYGHPLYVATTLGILAYQMRLLNRHDYGCVAAFCLPFISLLPIIPISHASYTELVISSEWYRADDLFGYLSVCVVLVAALLLVKRDDGNLLPRAKADAGCLSTEEVKRQHLYHAVYWSHASIVWTILTQVTQLGG